MYLCVSNKGTRKTYRKLRWARLPIKPGIVRQVPAIWTHQIEIIIITLLNHNWTMSEANVKDHTRLWGSRARQSLKGYLLVGSWLSGNSTYTHSKKKKEEANIWILYRVSWTNRRDWTSQILVVIKYCRDWAMQAVLLQTSEKEKGPSVNTQQASCSCSVPVLLPVSRSPSVSPCSPARPGPISSLAGEIATTAT